MGFFDAVYPGVEKKKEESRLDQTLTTVKKRKKIINAGLNRGIRAVQNFKERTNQSSVNVNAMQNDFFFIHRQVNPNYAKLPEGKKKIEKYIKPTEKNLAKERIRKQNERIEKINKKMSYF